MPRIHAGACMKPGDGKIRNLICHECIKPIIMVIVLMQGHKVG